VDPRPREREESEGPVIRIVLCTDAVCGQKVGGFGYVLYAEPSGQPAIRYEHRHALVPGLSQTQAELYAILAGLDSIGYALSSHGLVPTDVYLTIVTDSKASLHAIAHPDKQKDRKTRLLLKRIIRTVAGVYNSPPGGGAEFKFLSTDPEEGDTVDTIQQRSLLLRAHELSHQARTVFKGLR